METYTIQTNKSNFYDITSQVKKVVTSSNIESGICIVYCPHTTAAITINENADPDVVHDMQLGLDRAFPDRQEFNHIEGNSSAHLKASCLGSSVTVIIEKGELILGTWQSVYFCEFDGPRTRRFHVKIL